MGLFIGLGLFSISQNLEPIARKNTIRNLCLKMEALISMRNNFVGLSKEKNDIQEKIKKTNQHLESRMNIKTRFADLGSSAGQYLYSGEYICRGRAGGGN